MSTTHRGLPPPSAMALPHPSSSPSLGQIPDRWQHGNDDTQRSWLQAKSEEERRRQEEERRRQEEERTRQENVRLEIRKTELEMLREAFRGGMPPHLVPVIFTGGGALAGTSAEWANHYIAQLNQNQQQMVTGQQSNMISPPDSRIETRLLTASEHQTPGSGTMSTISRTPAQASMSHTPATGHMVHGSVHNTPSSHPSQHPPPPPPPGYSPFNLGMSPARPGSQQIHHAEPPRTSLPRINTNEMQVQAPPQGPPPGMNMQLSGLPSHQQSTLLNPHQAPHPHSQNHQPAPPPPESTRQAESSPIFFHHWQPPATHSSSSTPMASTSPASGKNAESPFQPQHYLAGNGNKKRGAPTIHNRHRSDSGSRGYEPYSKSAAARPRRTEGSSSFNDGNGSTGQFSISHMTTHDESPELSHREPPHRSRAGSQEPHQSHQHYSAGPDSIRDHSVHRERERDGSLSHGPPPSSRS